MRIVVVGATGALGKLVVEAASADGHDAVGISRGSGVDLMTGDGLVEALNGAGAVIDASAPNSIRTSVSVSFFGTVTRNLLRAEKYAGVPHHVAVSIVGAAQVNANYYAGKKVQEDLLRSQPEGWSILRTTQFHEFVRQMVAGSRIGPLQVVPKMRSQPIRAAEVAAEMVAIATGVPRGFVPDLAGPREEDMADMVRRYLAATGDVREVVEVRFPGAWGRGMRDGTLLPRSGTRRGAQTFDAWLSTISGSSR